jgi:hypothetical protein
MQNIFFKSASVVLRSSSYMLKDLFTKIVLAMSSEKNMPVFVMKAAGYVQNMPAVEVLPPTLLTRQNLSISEVEHSVTYVLM